MYDGPLIEKEKRNEKKISNLLNVISGFSKEYVIYDKQHQVNWERKR